MNRFLPLVLILAGCSDSIYAPTDAGLIDADLETGSTDANYYDVRRYDSNMTYVKLAGCRDLLLCENACRSEVTWTECVAACNDETTVHGQSLFEDLRRCIDNVCPGDAGSVCYGYNTNDCHLCQINSQNHSTGVCYPLNFVCWKDVQ